MLITPAYAQGVGGLEGTLGAIFPFLIILPIFYFLLIRPQQKRIKAHAEMVANIRRGDTVVTSGGLIGKVSKVTDDELTVDLGEGMKVRAVRSTISEVRVKGEPVEAK